MRGTGNRLDRIDESLGGKELFGCLQFRCQPAVGIGSGNLRSQQHYGRGCCVGWFKWLSQFDRAGRGDPFDSEDTTEVVDDATQLARSSPTHRNVVLLHGRGRQRVD